MKYYENQLSAVDIISTATIKMTAVIAASRESVLGCSFFIVDSFRE
jgi:hypothetical protein